MNQIIFEREFDERLLETFGDLLAAFINVPTADQEDSETVWFDSVNGVLKVSSSGA